MSRLIVIAAPALVDHASCARRLQGGRYLQDGGANGTFQRDDEWLALSNAGADYSDYDPARIRTAILNPQILFVRSNSDFLLDEFVLALPDQPDLIVDNTHGLILDIRQAQQLALSDRPWLDLAEL